MPSAARGTPEIPPVDAVVIGASAGAIEALGILLPALPPTTPWPVIAVVHVPANRPSLLAQLFTNRCHVPVREAQDKQVVAPGVWFAPPDYHLLVESEHTFALSVDDPENYSRPSIDVLFESAADAYGPRLAAIVLTGASADGAKGARAVRDAGGYVLVQDPATAESTIMPSRAIERADPHAIASLNEIADALRRAANAARGGSRADESAP